MKFTKVPVGLGMKYAELEIAAAHHWNHLQDEKKDPLTAIVPNSKHRMKTVTEDHYSGSFSTGRINIGNGITNGFFTIHGDKLAFTQKAVDLIHAYFERENS